MKLTPAARAYAERRAQRDAANEAARTAAIEAHPNCDDCAEGKGTTALGPPHSDVHAGHCTCDRCW